MGRSIVYCDKCGLLLKEEDFRNGKAFTADNRSYCANCRPTGSSTVLPKPASKVSSTRIPKQPAIESRRMMAVPAPAAPPPPPPAKNNTLLYVGIVGAVIGVLAIFAMMSGGSKEVRRVDDGPPDQSRTVVAPPVRPPEEQPAGTDRRREEAAKSACVKAYGIRSTSPNDLAGQWRAFEEAVTLSQGTSYSGDATTQLAAVRRRFEEERRAVDARAQEAVNRDQFQAALEIWEKEKRRFDVGEWTQPAATRIVELKNDFERRLGIQREAAMEAKRRGDEAEAKKIRGRVAAWGLVGFAEQIDQGLAEVTATKPETPPETGVPKALEAYRGRFRALLGRLAGRDYAEPVKAMEKLLAEEKDEAAKKEAAEDLENLRLAASVVQETAPLLPKLAKGQKVAITYWDPFGTPIRVDDVVLKIDATRLEIKFGEGSVVIPFGEITPASLGDLFKTRAAKKDTDARAAVMACLFEGDVDGAMKLSPSGLPARYVDAFKDGAKDDREKAARSLFYDAEREYFEPSSTAGAVAKYKSLLGDHAGTAFVRRNKAAIAARTDSTPRDLMISNGEMLTTAGFKQGKFGKIEAAWVSQADLDFPQMKDNFVEFEFPAQPDQEYRVWILSGGCCQEVFGCYCQGTELTGPNPSNPKEKLAVEPGSAAGLPLKPPSTSMKKLHSQHNGPKNPERFEWQLVGNLKFPTAGSKRIRILSNQKGFAVASAAVLLTKPGPPKESDLKELEKWKAETPGATASKTNSPAGSILREVWKDIIGGAVEDLVNQPAFKDDKPSESGLLTAFEGPTNAGQNYGARFRGYIHPPASGAYVFWIATDDNGELRLSSDDDPIHAKAIATCPSWTSPREYGKFPQQQSQPIELKAGRRYYIEALMKQGVGGDHVSVAWKLPSGVEEKPIPGTRLSPFILPKK